MSTATAIGQGASVWVVLAAVAVFVALLWLSYRFLFYVLAGRDARQRRRARNAFDLKHRTVLRRMVESQGATETDPAARAAVGEGVPAREASGRGPFSGDDQPRPGWARE